MHSFHHLGLEMSHTNNSLAVITATHRPLLEDQSADLSGMHPLSRDKMAWWQSTNICTFFKVVSQKFEIPFVSLFFVNLK
jgi:hypothetical protein